jgi:hypothetical protein
MYAYDETWMGLEAGVITIVIIVLAVSPAGPVIFVIIFLITFLITVFLRVVTVMVARSSIIIGESIIVSTVRCIAIPVAIVGSIAIVTPGIPVGIISRRSNITARQQKR